MEKMNGNEQEVKNGTRKRSEGKLRRETRKGSEQEVKNGDKEGK